MEDLRDKLRRFIYAIGGLVVFLLLIRFALKLLAASANSSPIVNFIYTITQPFVSPFIGIAKDISQGSSIIEVTSIVAIMMWIALMLILAELVTSFLYEKGGEIILSVINLVFKFVEFMLLARFVMRAFGINDVENSFVKVIYGLASIVYVPFQNIAPGINIGIGVIELSTLIALIIVIVLDVVTDGIFKSILGIKDSKDNI